MGDLTLPGWLATLLALGGVLSGLSPLVLGLMEHRSKMRRTDASGGLDLSVAAQNLGEGWQAFVEELRTEMVRQREAREAFEREFENCMLEKRALTNMNNTLTVRLATLQEANEALMQTLRERGLAGPESEEVNED